MTSYGILETEWSKINLEHPVITLENFEDGDDIVVLDSGLERFGSISDPSTAWSDI